MEVWDCPFSTDHADRVILFPFPPIQPRKQVEETSSADRILTPSCVVTTSELSGAPVLLKPSVGGESQPPPYQLHAPQLHQHNGYTEYFSMHTTGARPV